MTAPSLTYSKPLHGRNIRLLRLLPDDEDGRVQCSLVYHGLDSASSYHALSYVWGDATQTKRISCDGLPCDVTINLYHALRHVRRKYGDSLLWADALCINQTDTDERTRQVRVMEDIYRQANLVVIWLGEEEHGDREAYQLAFDLRRLIGDTVTDFHGVVAYINRGIDSSSDAELQALIAKREEWINLDKLIMRPWFARAWIIQELVMASATIMLTGDFAMETNVILNFASLTVIHPGINARAYMIPRASGPGHTEHYSPVTALRGLVATRRVLKNLILSDVLGMTTETKATDPRDRIFALIGLSEDIPRSFIDYRRERRDIVVDLSARLMRQTSFPVLKLAWPQLMEPSEGIPSWATDWTSVSGGPEPVSMLVPFDYSYEYGDPMLRFESEGKTIDSIKEIVESDLCSPSSVAPAASSDVDLLISTCVEAYDWMQKVFEVGRRNYNKSIGIEMDEAIWRSVVCDGAPLRYPAPPEYGEMFRAWLEWLTSFPAWVGEVKRLQELDEEIPNELRERGSVLNEIQAKTMPIQQNLDRIAYGRRFCATERGFLGWVPKSVKVRDEVVIFNGGHVPFVLRPCDRLPDATQFRTLAGKAQPPRVLLGDCYLHGLIKLKPGQLESFETQEILLA